MLGVGAPGSSAATPSCVAHSITTRIVRRRAVDCAAHPAAVGDDVGDVVERLAGQPLAGQHVRDPGRVGGQRLGGDPSLGLVERHHLLRAEERLARGHLQSAPRAAAAANGGLRLLARPRRAARRRARAPSTQPLAGRARRRSPIPNDGDDHVLGEELEVDVVAARASAGRSGGRWRRCRGRRPTSRSGSQACDARRARRSARRARRARGSRGSARAARPATRSSRRAAPAPWTAAWRRAASSEAVSSAFGLVDSTRVTQRSTTPLVDPVVRSPRWRIADWVRLPTILWTEERTTSAPHSSALGRQLAREAQVRAPGLVDDQRHAARVGDLGQRRRRRRRRRSRWARRSARRPRRASSSSAAASDVGRQAVGDAELGVELGRDEARLAARRGRARRSIDEWTLRWTTTRLADVARARGRSRGCPGGAVDQEPAAPRAPGLGGEPLGPLERRVERVGADVDPLDPGRDVVLAGPARRAPRRARVGARARPCGRGRGSGRDRASA